MAQKAIVTCREGIDRRQQADLSLRDLATQMKTGRLVRIKPSISSVSP